MEDLEFSVRHMDRTRDPLDDFYQFANGNWLKEHPVPPDRTSHGTFSILRDLNAERLRRILDHCSTKSRDRYERLCALFYASAMDVRTIDRLKLRPVKPLLSRISKIRDMEQLWRTVAYLEKKGVMTFFGSPFRGFRPRVSADKKRSSIYAFYLHQGGLSLPDREYYLNEQFAQVKSELRKHIARMFVLEGRSRKKAAGFAEEIMLLEEELARFSRSRAELRDQEKNYNRFSTKSLARKYSHLDLHAYLAELRLPAVPYVIVGQPEFLQGLDRLLSSTPLSTVRIYLEWQVLNQLSPYLHTPLSREHFRMFGRVLSGQRRQEPRWKLAIGVIDTCIGEALGSLYVRRYFSSESRERIRQMVEELSQVFKERLENIDWMTPETRKRALRKFSRFRAKIGYPDRFRDYRGLVLKSNEFLGNIMRSAEYDARTLISRVGKKVDRNEWLMTPPTVNAYFNPTGNEIVFPAGILQPPFFYEEGDDAINYGGIGAVIAHEITHGYDDQGSKYDERGNLKNWWGSEDMERFRERAARVSEYYSRLQVLPGFSVNGDLTLGENIADLGAVRLAFEALKRHVRKSGISPDLFGFTPEQRFFLSWANVWRSSITEEELKKRIVTDPHSPPNIRGSVPVANHPEFEKAFGGKQSGLKIAVW